MTAAAVPLPSPGPRWWRYVRRNRLVCPNGHHIPEKASFPEHGFILCDKHMGRGLGLCGTWLFVYAIRGGGIIEAEVQLWEKRAMEEIQTPGEMIHFLGIFPGGPDATGQTP